MLQWSKNDLKGRKTPMETTYVLFKRKKYERETNIKTTIEKRRRSIRRKRSRRRRRRERGGGGEDKIYVKHF